MLQREGAKVVDTRPPKAFEDSRITKPVRVSLSCPWEGDAAAFVAKARACICACVFLCVCGMGVLQTAVAELPLGGGRRRRPCQYVFASCRVDISTSTICLCPHVP